MSRAAAGRRLSYRSALFDLKSRLDWVSCVLSGGPRCSLRKPERLSPHWGSLIRQILSTSWVPGPGSTAVTEAAWALRTCGRVLLYGGPSRALGGVVQPPWSHPLDARSTPSLFFFFNSMRALFFYKFIYLFIYLWAALGLPCWAHAFSSCGKPGLLFVTGTCFSLRWLLLLRSMGSRCAGFSSCGSRAQ